MKLWIRVAWRVVEWPVNIVLSLIPAWMAWHFIPATYIKETKTWDFTGPVMGFTILSVLCLCPQLVESTPFLRWIRLQTHRIVTEERVKLTTEHANDPATTLVRPVEGEGGGL